MATEPNSPFPTANEVLPPPRSVPLRLWCSLLAGPVTIGGSAGFAFGMVFALIFVPAVDLIGPWRLARSQQQAPGWLERVTETRFHEGGGESEEGTPIFRCDYTFALANGQQVQGTSYTLGEKFHLPAPVPGGPVPRLPVTVEYDPQHPSTSRIQGTRTSPYGPEVLFVVLFPVAGLAVALGGLWVGWRRGRLLRDGEVVAATITGCQFGAGDSGTFLPPGEYKHQTATLRAGFASHPLMHAVTGFMVVWTLLATVMFVGGVIFCVGGLVALLFFFPAPPQEKSLFVLGFGGFLVLWLVMGGVMVRSGWRACWGLRRRGDDPIPPVPVKCTYEFRPPEGEVVQAKCLGRLAETLGPEPPQPALYDPARPKHALLLSGLWPGVWIGETGCWETNSGADGLLRMLVTLVLLAGPFVAWAFLF
jgi:hypothetical protein